MAEELLANPHAERPTHVKLAFSAVKTRFERKPFRMFHSPCPIVNLVRSNLPNEGRLYDAASGGNMMRQETKRLATMTVLLGFFVIILNTTIVNVSLAHIGKDLHGTTASLQWVVDAPIQSLEKK